MPANTGDSLAVMLTDGMPADRKSLVGAETPSSTEATDAQLVALARDGDASAFAALTCRHYRAAFAVALANTHTRADAEDVCHDGFVRAAEALEDCRHPDRFAPWLCMIIRNHARNTKAKQRVRRAAPLDDHVAASGDDPSRDAELADLRARLTHALGTLPVVQREVVLLHDLDGWTHDDIATLIGTSPGMSRQHLFKARKRLRAALGGQRSEDE